MTLEPILEVCHLSKSFGTHQVLRDVNFTVHPGDVTSILGSSGSGKSTLLRCINLLERPNQGEVRFHGRPITGRGTDASAYRTRVGMVFQPLFQYERAGELHGGTGKGTPPEP